MAAASALHAWSPQEITADLPAWITETGVTGVRSCSYLCGCFVATAPAAQAHRLLVPPPPPPPPPADGEPPVAHAPQAHQVLFSLSERPTCPVAMAAILAVAAAQPPPVAAQSAHAAPAPSAPHAGHTAAGPAALGIPLLEDPASAWSVGALSQAPAPFDVPTLSSCLLAARAPNAGERVVLNPANSSPSAIVNDPFTNGHFNRLKLQFAVPEVDTIPRRMVASVLPDLAEAAILLSCVAQALAQPASAAIRDTFTTITVPVRERLPDREVLGLEPGADPTYAQVFDRLIDIIHGTRGRLLYAGHFPNALTAFRPTGIEYLTGTAERIADVTSKPFLSHWYEQIYAPQATRGSTSVAPLAFRGVATALVQSHEVRVSALTLTHPAWPPRERLLQQHWRWFWHAIIKAGTETQKVQAPLASRLTNISDARRALGGGGGGAAAGARDRSPTPPGDRAAGAHPPKRLKTGTNSPPPDPAKNDRPRAPTPPPATGPVVCRAVDGCKACGVPRGTVHTDACSWLAGKRADAASAGRTTTAATTSATGATVPP